MGLSFVVSSWGTLRLRETDFLQTKIAKPVVNVCIHAYIIF